MTSSGTYRLASPCRAITRAGTQPLENFAKVYELTAGTYKFEILDILASSKHVAAYVHATGRRNSKTLDQG